MAVDRLQLARQEILRFSRDGTSASRVQSAQLERRQRWQDCSAMSETCAGLFCSVSDVQRRTFDQVFARQVRSTSRCVVLVYNDTARWLAALQLTAYKLVLLHQFGTKHTSLVSFLDKHTK